MGSIVGVILMTVTIRHLFLANNDTRMAYAIAALIAAPTMFIFAAIGSADGGPFATAAGAVYVTFGAAMAGLLAGWAKFKEKEEYVYVRPKTWKLALGWIYLALLVSASILVLATESTTLFS